VHLPAALGPVPPLRGNFGATPLGLIYGTTALAIFIFAALLGWRRSHPSWKVGTMQGWLKAHIWLTIFTLPLVAFHCGFHGGGPMTQFLLWLYGLVMVSGFWGLALQHIVPKIMRDYLPEEVIFDEIPFIRNQIISQAQAMREQCSTLVEEAQAEYQATASKGGTATLTISQAHAISSLIRFIDDGTLPYLRSESSRRFRLHDGTVAADLFRLLKLQMPDIVHPTLEKLENLCEEKRRIDFQSRLHHWLHVWLLVHAPASLLLVVLTLLHAIVAAYLYP